MHPAEVRPGWLRVRGGCGAGRWSSWTTGSEARREFRPKQVGASCIEQPGDERRRASCEACRRCAFCCFVVGSRVGGFGPPQPPGLGALYVLCPWLALATGEGRRTRSKATGSAGDRRFDAVRLEAPWDHTSSFQRAPSRSLTRRLAVLMLDGHASGGLRCLACPLRGLPGRRV